MAKRANTRNPLKRIARSGKSALTRRHSADTVEPVAKREAEPAAEPRQARRTQRQTDIPMAMLAGAYMPTHTTPTAPFRPAGADQQRDQEFGRGPEDDPRRDEAPIT